MFTVSAGSQVAYAIEKSIKSLSIQTIITQCLDSSHAFGTTPCNLMYASNADSMSVE